MKKNRVLITRKSSHFNTFSRPEGGITQGKTANNRLRRVDYFLCRYDPWLIKREDGDFRNSSIIDLGYGSSPVTTLETSLRLRRLNPRLRVIGIEIDPDRVVSAQAYSDSNTEFRLGGFNFPLNKTKEGIQEKARIVRAFNVLRQYDENSVNEAYRMMAMHVLPGGLMIEGTSDPRGSIWSANLMRRPQNNTPGNNWDCEAIVFSTSFISDFSPSMFCSVLPKNLIHRMVPGEVIFEFINAWEQSARCTKPVSVWGKRQWFRASAERLSGYGYNIDLRSSWLKKGWLIFYQ